VPRQPVIGATGAELAQDRHAELDLEIRLVN
jgi:hypothetical protein